MSPWRSAAPKPRDGHRRFDGFIAGAGFASGDRFVAGVWRGSPFGPFCDVMWSRPDGARILIAEGPPAAFVRRHYRFDEVWERDVRLVPDPSRLVLESPGLRLALVMGRPTVLTLLLALRPDRLAASPGWLTVEHLALRPLLRPLLGGAGAARAVRTRGRTADGVREWYGIRDYRPLAGGSATVGGADLGPLAVVGRRMGFGFSEFPARPAVVAVTSLFREP